MISKKYKNTLESIRILLIVNITYQIEPINNITTILFYTLSIYFSFATRITHDSPS